VSGVSKAGVDTAVDGRMNSKKRGKVLLFPPEERTAQKPRTASQQNSRQKSLLDSKPVYRKKHKGKTFYGKVGPDVNLPQRAWGSKSFPNQGFRCQRQKRKKSQLH